MLIGCDFSSSPRKAKPIVLAIGSSSRSTVRLDRFEHFVTLQAFGAWLARPGDWLGGFDLPFGLPRELVLHQNWPDTWEACVRHYAGLERKEIRQRFAAFCAARPAGGKFAHRATDGPAGSSPSMKWVNPPVAYMLHAGVPLLLDAGVHLPGLHAGSPGNRDARGRPRRIALEAYPGLLAREVLGRPSYKSDTRAKQTAERRMQRERLLQALEEGRTRLGLNLRLDSGQRETLCADASGDHLDAVLCLIQAAWGWKQGAPWYGLPRDTDALEGWILSAPADAASRSSE